LKIIHTPVIPETNCIVNETIHYKMQMRFNQNIRFGAVKAVLRYESVKAVSIKI
jgi:hypothetical protein